MEAWLKFKTANQAQTTFPGNRGEEITSDDTKKMVKNTANVTKLRIDIRTLTCSVVFYCQHIRYRNI